MSGASTHLRDKPERAAQLAATLRGVDEDMRRYKNLPPLIKMALAWLDGVAMV